MARELLRWSLFIAVGLACCVAGAAIGAGIGWALAGQSDPTAFPDPHLLHIIEGALAGGGVGFLLGLLVGAQVNDRFLPSHR